MVKNHAHTEKKTSSVRQKYIRNEGTCTTDSISMLVLILLSNFDAQHSSCGDAVILSANTHGVRNRFATTLKMHNEVYENAWKEKDEYFGRNYDANL